MNQLLTAKQEKFCRLVADKMLQTDAYLTAYDWPKGSDRERANMLASRLARKDHIRDRIEELRDIQAKKIKWSKEKAAEGLIKMWEVAFAQMSNKRLNVENVRAMERATTALNKLMEIDPETQIRREELQIKKQILKAQGMSGDPEDEDDVPKEVRFII